MRLRKDPSLEIRVVSLAGLAILKLFSWQVRGIENSKDAKDLAILLQNYARAGNEDRLFGTDSELMDLEDFDQDNAAARLLGRDMAKICTENQRETLVALLDTELDDKGDYKLLRAMMNTYVDNDLERNMLLLQKLRVGITE